MKRPSEIKLREVLHGGGVAEVRVLAPRQELTSPHVFMDLRQLDGAAEIGITEARRLHDWLGRFLAWYDEGKA